MAEEVQNVCLTRRVSFSSGHRYWDSRLSEAENRRRFGRWASPYSHGHNYVLDVSAAGPINIETGMVVNIKRLDDLLQEKVVGQFDQKSLNDEVGFFQHHPPTTENLLLYIRSELAGVGDRLVLEDGVGGTSSVILRQLRLFETPLLWADWKPNQMTLTRSYEFAAAHRLNAPSLSHEQNLALFGKCNNPNGHGHNYVLEVTVAGNPNPETGMLTDLEALDHAVMERVINRFDHKNLDLDLPEFSAIPTTSENVVKVIFDLLQGSVPGKLASVRLHETARNAFEIHAAS